MHVYCWTSSAVMQLQTSKRGGSSMTLSYTHSRGRRYHIGRHVANLQVTNTYEGTFVSQHLQIVATLLSLAAGYPHTHTWQSYHRSPGLYLKHYIPDAGNFVRMEEGRITVSMTLSLKHTKQVQQDSNRTKCLQLEKGTGCIINCPGLRHPYYVRLGRPTVGRLCRILPFQSVDI